MLSVMGKKNKEKGLGFLLCSSGHLQATLEFTNSQRKVSSSLEALRVQAEHGALVHLLTYIGPMRTRVTPPESGFQRDLRGCLAQASSPGALFLSCVSDRGCPVSVGIQFPKAAFLGMLLMKMMTVTLKTMLMSLMTTTEMMMVLMMVMG